MPLTREAILSASLPRKEIEVPEWGGSVFIRALTGAEAIEFSQRLDTNEEAAVLVSLAVVDADGNRLFTKEDVQALLGTRNTALQRVTKAILEFNAISDATVTAAGND